MKNTIKKLTEAGFKIQILGLEPNGEIYGIIENVKSISSSCGLYSREGSGVKMYFGAFREYTYHHVNEWPDYLPPNAYSISEDLTYISDENKRRIDYWIPYPTIDEIAEKLEELLGNLPKVFGRAYLKNDLTWKSYYY